MEGLLGGVSRAASLGALLTDTGRPLLHSLRPLLHSLRPPRWWYDPQSHADEWLHAASGVSCSSLPVFANVSISLSDNRVHTVLVISWQCSLDDLALVILLEAIYAPYGTLRSEISFSTRPNDFVAFSHPEDRSTLIHSLLQKVQSQSPSAHLSLPIMDPWLKYQGLPAGKKKPA